MTPDDERAAFWKALHTVDDRVTALEAVVNTRNDLMRESIQAAVKEAMPKSLLSDEEHRWVQLAIERQVQMIAFRRAVIEKTLLGLIWAGIIAAGLVVKDYAVSHGMWRP